ncbi:sugar phosphate isomerase/epimerase family protein [Jiangella asiatica]|uniref:Sugar phosphate isomerase/epimerase n=1 Tax=Jiangella asiatica TaxID=2530372 RepID=A0A4R5CIS5_9ACTN|nr:sugar phosphate isomerase/epimerase [Jiangella asiatica]TDD97272.1 sugar phosphate isomerase/epimerase [Jiangella asiatica]
MAHPEINRRRFFSAVAGTTMAVTAAGVAAPSVAGAAKGMLVPPGKIGIQLFTIRNLVSSLGFRAVFEELARIGYQNVEFAGYTSPAEPGITVEQIRQLLDDNGLTPIGSHVSLNAFRTNLQLELDRAEILGLPFVGTANEPVTAANRTVAGYQAAAAEFNAFGAAARERGIRWYQHNHHNEFRFANDDPSTRLYDVLLAETDPKLVFLEMDIYWAYVGQHIAPGFDPIDYVVNNKLRYPLFHAKDGRRSAAANGYDIVEFGAGDIDFGRFYSTIGSRGRHYSLWEQDNAPNTPAEAGGALGAAERSYDAMCALRG